MIKFADVELPDVSMVVAEDFSVAGSVRFHIIDNGKHLFFLLSADDKNRLLELIQSV